MTKNNTRYDLSKRLIHFFRVVNLNGKSSVHFPENWGLDHIVETEVLPPFFLLRSAIRNGLIFATWAQRKGKRTIYGKKPAVCFTEMPLAAFLQTSQYRSQLGQAISSYGISFVKTDLFRIGARPVIYGLTPAKIKTKASSNGQRVFLSKFLPLAEQFRYVSYNPVGYLKIDWTHEREWRWPYLESIKNFEKELKDYGIVSEIEKFPSLDLYKGNLFDIGVIVKTQEEAKLILFDILALYDRNGVNNYKFIFYTEQIESIGSILSPEQEKMEIAKSTLKLSPYIKSRPIKDRKLVDKFHLIVTETVNEFRTIELGEAGGCWLWFFDGTSPLVRALVRAKKLVINKHNKYLYRLKEFSENRSLMQREKMTQRLAEKLKKEFNLEIGYYSVLDSVDENDIPYYNSQNYDDKFRNRFFNIATESLP
jgi:hypothetical protein